MPQVAEETQRQCTRGDGMDFERLQQMLKLSGGKRLWRKAESLHRLSKKHFDSHKAGVNEVCKYVLCFQFACQMLEVRFNRAIAIHLSGVTKVWYLRCTHAMETALGYRKRVDVQELVVQFQCMELIEEVNSALALYKQRFAARLPEKLQANVNFNRPVFTCVAFYLCAKKNDIKVDKMKLMELSGPPYVDFHKEMVSMMNVCFDVFGIQGEQLDPRLIEKFRENNADKNNCLVHEESDSNDDSDHDYDN